MGGQLLPRPAQFDGPPHTPPSSLGANGVLPAAHSALCIAQLARMEEKTCTPEWLADVLAGDKVLLIDCRPQNEFISGHIAGSINVSLPTLLQRRLRKGNFAIACAIPCNPMKEKFLQRSRTHDVVLYDAGASDANANTTSILSLLLEKLTKDGCKTKILLGGFSHFQEAYPALVTSEGQGGLSPVLGLNSLSVGTQQDAVPDETSPESTFPVEVIPRLFLGDAKNSADLQSLEKYNIKYILNVTPNLPNQFQHNLSIKYKQIPVNDHWSQNVLAYFPEAIAFIDEGRSHGVGVLVHCVGGVSRSVTVTVAYLMAHQHMSLNDAYDFVKRAKPNISPNFNFMGQLLDFEQALKAGAFLRPMDDIVAGWSSSYGSARSASPAPSMSANQSCPCYCDD